MLQLHIIKYKSLPWYDNYMSMWAMEAVFCQNVLSSIYASRGN